MTLDVRQYNILLPPNSILVYFIFVSCYTINKRNLLFFLVQECSDLKWTFDRRNIKDVPESYSLGCSMDVVCYVEYSRILYLNLNITLNNEKCTILILFKINGAIEIHAQYEQQWISLICDISARLCNPLVKLVHIFYIQKSFSTVGIQIHSPSK